MGNEVAIHDDSFFSVIDKNSIANLTPQEKAYVTLKANGFNKTEIAKILGIKKKSKDSRMSQLGKSVRSKSIVNPKMVKLAHTAVKETLEMQPVTVVETTTDNEGNEKTVEKKLYPSHSNRLDAAKMILARSEPEVQKRVNVHLDGEDVQNLVNLDLYKDEVIDIDVSEVSQNSNVSEAVETQQNGL